MRPCRRRGLDELAARPGAHLKRHPAELVDPHGRHRTASRNVGDDGGDGHGACGNAQPWSLSVRLHPDRHAQRTTLAAVEPVYGTVIQVARLAWRLQGLKFTVTGVENLPATGGAVVAINHTSYFDFTFAGLPAYKQGRGRKVRFMAKKEVFDHKITGPLMRSLRHIEVDRDSGAASFEAAVAALKDGELVGVYPEATISRSFEIKEFKSGAARMAIEADVPIVPHIVWGAQRIWTKGHPKKLWRPKVPITVAVGEPIAADAARAGADRAAAFADAASAGARPGRLRPASARRVLGAAPARRRRAVAGRSQPDGRRGGRREGGAKAARRAQRSGPAGAPG